MNRRSHDSSLGVAYLKAGSSARAELGGGIANGSERAQDQEFALRKSESASGVEAAEAELSQEPRRASLDGSGRAARLCLVSFPYRGACSARPFAYRSASETVPCAGSGSSTPLARNTFVDRRYRVERAREPRNSASWYLASRISTGATPTSSAPCVCDVSCGNVWRHASTMTVISSRVRSSSTPVSKTSPKMNPRRISMSSGSLSGTLRSLRPAQTFVSGFGARLTLEDPGIAAFGCNSRHRCLCGLPPSSVIDWRRAMDTSQRPSGGASFNTHTQSDAMTARIRRPVTGTPSATTWATGTEFR